jgi:hypothetical protein
MLCPSECSWLDHPKDIWREAPTEHNAPCYVVFSTPLLLRGTLTLSLCRPKGRSLDCGFTLKTEVVMIHRMSVRQNTSTWRDHAQRSTAASIMLNKLQQKIPRLCSNLWRFLCVSCSCYVQYVTRLGFSLFSVFSLAPNTGGTGSRLRWLLQRVLNR